MKYMAVVFDMDGTLLDTLDDLADSMNRVLRRRGFPVHPTDSYRVFVGSGAARLVARALPMGHEALLEECLAEFLLEYEAGWKVKTRLYEGVAELLDALAARNIPMAVLTNKPQAFAELCMEEFLSPWRFSLTMGQRPGVAPKPDPAAPQEVIRHLRVEPAQILYLGDTDVDMFTAVNAGMCPVGVLWGFRTKEELQAAGAEVILRHPLELIALLD